MRKKGWKGQRSNISEYNFLYNFKFGRMLMLHIFKNTIKLISIGNKPKVECKQKRSQLNNRTTWGWGEAREELIPVTLEHNALINTLGLGKKEL